MIEYEHIHELLGKDRERIWFTNLKTEENMKKLGNFGRTFLESIRSMNLKNICILDPEAEQTLKPEENPRFEFYVFGGILGDHPPKKRTAKELTKFLPESAEKRNIGKKQMSTDNAVYTVFQIAEKGKKFDELKFKDEVEIEINDVESVELPYRYNIDEKGGIFMSPKIVEYLKKKQGF